MASTHPGPENFSIGRQKTADRVYGNLPVDPVVMVAVSPEERRREVQNSPRLYHERRVQRLADRRLGVAREVLPRPIEERAA